MSNIHLVLLFSLIFKMKSIDLSAAEKQHHEATVSKPKECLHQKILWSFIREARPSPSYRQTELSPALKQHGWKATVVIRKRRLA